MTSKPQYRQINTADFSDDHIDSISDSMKVPKLLRLDAREGMTARQEAVTLSRQKAAAPRGQSRADREMQKTTFRIPQSLNNAMKRDALEGRTHVRIIVLAALRGVGYRIEARSLPESLPTARQPSVSPSRTATPDQAPTMQPGPSKQQKLSIDIPRTVTDDLRRDALDQGTTIRAIVLRALRSYGYSVADADLAPGAGGNC